MVLITIEMSRTASREYLISVSKENKTIYMRNSAGCDAGGAAASAVRAAMTYVGDYTIIAPKEVMEHIPVNVRSGTMNL